MIMEIFGLFNNKSTILVLKLLSISLVAILCLGTIASITFQKEITKTIIPTAIAWLFHGTETIETIDIIITATPVPTLTLIPIPQSSPTPTPYPTDTPDLSEPPQNAEAGAIWVSPVDGTSLVYVPASEFKMGSYLPGPYSAENPQRNIYLDAFWIDQTEVTNGKYMLCVQDGACKPPKGTSSYSREYYFGEDDYADYPVVYVSWTDANYYCTWAERRLPTEAEWEKAARGTDGRTYPWGEEKPNCTLANYWEYEIKTGQSLNHVGCEYDTTKVGQYPSGISPFGILDSVGNVMEWVADWYERDYFEISPSQNPQGPEIGKLKVVRGLFGYPEIVYTEGNEAPDREQSYAGIRYLWIYHQQTARAAVPGDTSGYGPNILEIRYIFDLRVGMRAGTAPDIIDYSLGFRCARAP
jgi:formylglycine-generating enzyme required for sulfatase activity